MPTQKEQRARFGKGIDSVVLDVILAVFEFVGCLLIG
jgi:hypothetical protein